MPDTGQSSSAGQTAGYLPSLLLSGQCDQWSCTLMDTSILNELMNQTLSFVERKWNFNTAVLAGNDTFLTENITHDRKRFTTQSKRMII